MNGKLFPYSSSGDFTAFLPSKRLILYYLDKIYFLVYASPQGVICSLCRVPLTILFAYA